jgi:hypothetical protein
VDRVEYQGLARIDGGRLIIGRAQLVLDPHRVRAEGRGERHPEVDFPVPVVVITVGVELADRDVARQVHPEGRHPLETEVRRADDLGHHGRDELPVQAGHLAGELVVEPGVQRGGLICLHGEPVQWFVGAQLRQVLDVIHPAEDRCEVERLLVIAVNRGAHDNASLSGPRARFCPVFRAAGSAPTSVLP